MAVLTFDIRSLVSTPADGGSFGKVNFEVGALPTYVEGFLAAIRGQEEVVLTGAGPAWLYLVLWHQGHGVVPDGGLKFQAPGVEYTPCAAGPATGPATGDGSAVAEGQVVIDVTTLTEAPAPGGRVNFELGRVAEYQAKALGLVPAFKPGRTLPEFEVVLTGPGPVWLFLALTAALHSRGGAVVYSAPNAPRVVVVNHK